MRKIQLTVQNEVGLHARAAAQFVERAKAFSSSIKIRNLWNDKGWVDAKSVLRVLTLAVEQGHDIELSLEGDDEVDAAEAMREFVESELPNHNL